MYRTIAATAVAGVFFLAGCGGGAGQQGGSESVKPAETSPARTEPSITPDTRTTTTPEPGLPDRPPDSTVTFGDRTVTGALGSYCWGSVCADMAGIPVPPERDRLAVPAGATLVFDFGGEGPYKADAAAYPLDPEARTLPGPDGVRFLAPGGGRPIPEAKDLKAVRSDGRTRIIADLPPGEFTLSVSVDPGGGDASYFYRLRVDAATTEGSPAPPASG